MLHFETQTPPSPSVILHFWPQTPPPQKACFFGGDPPFFSETIYGTPPSFGGQVDNHLKLFFLGLAEISAPWHPGGSLKKKKFGAIFSIFSAKSQSSSKNRFFQFFDVRITHFYFMCILKNFQESSEGVGRLPEKILETHITFVEF